VLRVSSIHGRGTLNAFEHRFGVGEGMWQQVPGRCDPVVQQLVEDPSHLGATVALCLVLQTDL
jgi:hypothetical protein